MAKLNRIYKRAFRSIDRGKSYDQISQKTGIPVDLLRIEHINFSKQNKNYDQQIQKYSFELINRYGLQSLSIKNIDQLIKNIPYRFRFAVKHLIYNLKKDGLNALS